MFPQSNVTHYQLFWDESSTSKSTSNSPQALSTAPLAHLIIKPRMPWHDAYGKQLYIIYHVSLLIFGKQVNLYRAGLTPATINL